MSEYVDISCSNGEHMPQDEETTKTSLEIGTAESSDENMKPVVINGIISDDSASNCCTSDSGDDVSYDRDEIAKLKLRNEENSKVIAKQQIELENYSRKYVDLLDSKKDLEQELEEVKKHKYLAIKDKESMVMRYAVSEKHLIDLKSGKDQIEKKGKEYHKECEYLQCKLKNMESEKTRICNMLDNKCYELRTSLQEVDRFKQDFSALETKLKWSQNSLKTEIELRKESDTKVEVLTNKVQEFMEIVDKAKKDAQEAIKEYQTSQENRAFVLDQQVKEQQANLILLRHEKEDREQQMRNLQTELDRIQRKQMDVLQENNTLSMKVQSLERERSECELKFSELKAWSDQQKQNTADLHAKTACLEKMQLQLKSEQQQLLAANEQISLLKQRNLDVESDIECCRQREAELLIFTQQLTEKNVKLQSEFTSMDTKVQQLSCEQMLLKRTAKEHESKSIMLASQLVEDKARFSEENEKLTLELTENVKRCEQLTQEVADQKGENVVIKRKLELSLREVNKELNQCRKKIEHYETVGIRSSSSSNSSLNTVERINGNNTNIMENGENLNSPDQVKVVQPDRIGLPDRQVLIEHIVKLQRVSARKSEKLDFLEEHVNTLVEELQRKSHLLQSYILREQSGTLSSNTMDNNKAILAKHSGVMASLYGSRITDPTVTLELSLDINRKLQAILEDALLKNITLKGNVDTLGAEIDRLKHLNSQQ